MSGKCQVILRKNAGSYKSTTKSESIANTHQTTGSSG
jgi:hypothetical protein